MMGECPYCNDETGNLNSHIRMSAGDHADQHEYPEDWDPNEHERAGDPAGEIEEADPDPTTGTADDGMTAYKPTDEPGEIETEEMAELGFSDSTTEARDYECGNCSEPLEYLGGDDRAEGGKECPECGERVYWSMVEA